MASRRKQEPSALGLLVTAPWWISFVLAFVAYAGVMWLLPVATSGNMYLKAIAHAMQPLAPIVFWFLVALSGIAYFVQRKKGQGAFTLASIEPAARRPNGSITLDPDDQDSLGQTWRDSRTEAKQPRPTHTTWSLDLLREIEWKRFEELCAAFYREVGLRTETIRCGADGGVDAKLYEAGSDDPVAIVQCKAWNSRPVGVKPVRELLGVMTHQGVKKGIFIATGDFTKEAKEFATTNPLDLVDGKSLLDMIDKLPVGAVDRLLAVATTGDYTTPTCPSCGIKMVVRNSARGTFWGCTHFPQCKHKFFFKTEAA